MVVDTLTPPFEAERTIEEKIKTDYLEVIRFIKNPYDEFGLNETQRDTLIALIESYNTQEELYPEVFYQEIRLNKNHTLPEIVVRDLSIFKLCTIYGFSNITYAMKCTYMNPDYFDSNAQEFLVRLQKSFISCLNKETSEIGSKIVSKLTLDAIYILLNRQIR